MINIISLGAGVQSSTMALMAAAGEITPMPDCAIFADTGDEPESVYEWLRWLEKQLPFPVVKVSIGTLSLAAMSPRPSENGGYLRPALPVYFKDAGVGQRHCTMDFKITPVQRYANMLRRGGMVSMWLGISTDEAHRMKPSRLDWAVNRYPLIENRQTRLHCIEWMAKHKFPKPPRSACRYCPYHSDDEWIRLKTEEPKEFWRAVQFEKDYQRAAAETALKHVPYFHSDCKPLDEVEFITGRQPDLFGNECEGMCGV